MPFVDGGLGLNLNVPTELPQLDGMNINAMKVDRTLDFKMNEKIRQLLLLLVKEEAAVSMNIGSEKRVFVFAFVTRRDGKNCLPLIGAL